MMAQRRWKWGEPARDKPQSSRMNNDTKKQPQQTQQISKLWKTRSNLSQTLTRRSLCGSMYMHWSLYRKSLRIASALVWAALSSSSRSSSVPANGINYKVFLFETEGVTLRLKCLDVWGDRAIKLKNTFQTEGYQAFLFLGVSIQLFLGLILVILPEVLRFQSWRMTHWEQLRT